MAYRSRFKSKEVDDLFEAIMLLDGLDECYRFFEDLCTVNKIHAMSQRWQVAKLLVDNKTYSEIEQETKASTATISRINKCLLYGAKGYKKVLKKQK